jgi:hypothetical protein
MANNQHGEPRQRDLDAIALAFLASEFTDSHYANWPIFRRVDAYLRRCSLGALADDGATYEALVQRIMANIGRARRSGMLRPHPWQAP